LWIEKNRIFIIGRTLISPPALQKMKYRMVVRLGKLILSSVLFVGMAMGMLHAQAVNANALKAFQTSSGGAAATWNAGPNNTWEASWTKEGQKMVYCYDQAGLLQQKKSLSNIASFPATINSSIHAAYPKGNVQYAYKVIDRTNQKFYEVQVANGVTQDRMRYSLEGKPVGKTSMAAAPQPMAPQPTASAVVAAPKPAPAVVKPTAAAPVATKPIAAAAAPAPAKPNPATVAATPAKQPVSQPIAMRGESATTTKTTTVVKDDLIDDDLGDLLEDDDDFDDLLKDDENWDDINLDDPADDDSDLLDGTDDLDDDLGLDDLDDDDGF
jgi:hypothetical protein